MTHAVTVTLAIPSLAKHSRLGLEIELAETKPVLKMIMKNNEKLFLSIVKIEWSN